MSATDSVVPHPILTDEETLPPLKALDGSSRLENEERSISRLSQAQKLEAEGLDAKPLDRICAARRNQAITDGYSLIVLSDRAM